MLTEQGGADPINVRQALRAGFAESRVLELQLERMVARNFTTKTGSAGQLSALEDALDTARALDLKPMPYSTLTADLLRTLVERSGDDRPQRHDPRAGTALAVRRRPGRLRAGPPADGASLGRAG